MLGTGEFVSNFLTTMGFELSFLPAVIFVVSGFIGFAMGTSWGTAALILPIVLGVFPESDPLFLVTIGATLAGAVYGDHISPISDTTILSSAGAECNHLRHVATQLPYASLVAVICLFGYLVAGFTGSPWPSLIGGIAVAIIIVIVTRVFGNKKSCIGIASPDLGGLATGTLCTFSSESDRRRIAPTAPKAAVRIVSKRS